MLSLSFRYVKNRVMLGLFVFWSMSFGVSSLQASSASALGYMRPKENPGNSPPCHSLGSKFPRRFAILSLTFKVFSCLVYIQCPGINRGKSVSIPFTPSCWKQKSSILMLFKNVQLLEFIMYSHTVRKIIWSLILQYIQHLFCCFRWSAKTSRTILGNNLNKQHPFLFPEMTLPFHHLECLLFFYT